MDNVDCSDSVEILDDCDFNDWGVNDCHHRDDVGVICVSGEWSHEAKSYNSKLLFTFSCIKHTLIQ